MNEVKQQRELAEVCVCVRACVRACVCVDAQDRIHISKITMKSKIFEGLISTFHKNLQTKIFRNFQLQVVLFSRLRNHGLKSNCLQESGVGFHSGFLLGGKEVEEKARMMKLLFNRESLHPVKKSLVSCSGFQIV